MSVGQGGGRWSSLGRGSCGRALLGLGVGLGLVQAVCTAVWYVWEALMTPGTWLGIAGRGLWGGGWRLRVGCLGLVPGCQDDYLVPLHPGVFLGERMTAAVCLHHVLKGLTQVRSKDSNPLPPAAQSGRPPFSEAPDSSIYCVLDPAMVAATSPRAPCLPALSHL